MELRSGRVLDGKVVLDDASGLSDGDEVSVLVATEAEVVGTDEELRIIDAGRASKADGTVEAFAFLRALRARDR